MSQQLFSSESVTEGHPDKVCDRISDAILDALLDADPHSRVAVETMAATGLIHVAGEVTTEAYVEIPEIVRREILSIGYDSSRVGFDGASCGVSISLDGQSPDIAGGVDEALEVRGTDGGDPRDRLGAGDQGIMFGYASSDTPDLMPAPIWLAHRLAKRLTDVRKQGIVEGLRPDGKTQVTLAYEGGRPVGIDTIVVSTQHDETLTQSAIADAVRAHVIDPVIEESGLALATGEMKALINPSGRFVLGGPAADAGLTGRKIIVDTYGGMARHGGGAFSGKDPSKVDRSATYAARWVAKNGCRPALRDSAGLRDWTSTPDRPVRRYLRHLHSSRGAHRRRDPRGLRPATARHDRGPGPAAPDLPRDGSLRPLRSRAVPVGGYQPRRRASGRPRMSAAAEQIDDYVPSWDTEEARRSWRRRTSLEMIISGFIGLVTSFVLSIEAWQLAADSSARFGCDVSSVLSCSAVAQTWQARILGFPNAFLGIFFEAVVLAISVAIFAGVTFPRWYMACTNLLYTIALFFAFWLFGQSYFIIQVLCPWCLLITLTTTLVFGGITRINIRDGVIPAPASLRRIVGQGLDWALWGLIVFGVLAMVVGKYGLRLLG